jgi:hypothetical protein
MKVILTEKQLKLYKKYLSENSDNEARALPRKAADKIKTHTNDVLKGLYGDKFGTKDERSSYVYGVNVTYDGEISTGLFSIGNAKLSDDTLIINFTSALECPSMQVCPVAQKACYAVAGENRLPDVRRKNLMVQNIWYEALKNAAKKDKNAIDKVFSIAKLYIEVLNAKKPNGEFMYKKPLRFVRFNEAGDFPHQKILEAAARFAEFAKGYGIMCMAYSAKKQLDFTKIADGTSEPIDKLIKINASREDMKVSSDTTKQRFFATPMDFKTVLSHNDKVEEISDKEANILKCKGTIKGKNGINSIPRLTMGKWNGGEGWYYVCPCSFWKYNKDKAESLFYNEIGLTAKDVSVDDTERKRLRRQLSVEQKEQLKRILNKIKSPCGIECAVCHDMEGGITPDGERVTEYFVLTATHGATAGNFDPRYAQMMRTGQDSKAKWKNSDENPKGLETKYDKNKEAYKAKKNKENQQ